MRSYSIGGNYFIEKMKYVLPTLLKREMNTVSNHFEFRNTFEFYWKKVYLCDNHVLMSIIFFYKSLFHYYSF